ncbi:MAG: bifunctional diaminohydroxyphosphoribosylaminopyrimidine deaminase/5-amino-6-(5-phosphoribosylamino)uracil reductase RibD [Burkholderiales bacterium]
MDTTPPAVFTEADERHMLSALALAEQAIGLSDPNPRVGCLLVAPNGQVIGQGHTQAAGGPHAEAMALRAARAAGHALTGATAYVTLEPCAHHGRTPPCCEALIEAGIARVVVALGDPNPLVAGQGLARLQAAGIATACGLLAEPARELNIGFLSRMLRGRPWVRMKVAASLDGRTALPDGRSQWITSAAARTDGHAWRRRAGALLTGVGTVRDDDPRLDVRLVPTPRQPLRGVVDAGLGIAAEARILQPPGDVLLYTAATPATRPDLLARPNVQIVCLPDARNGKVDLGALLADLGQRGINEVHLEAGAALNGSFVREGWVDELLLYLAPKLIGAGRELARLGPLAQLDDAPALEWVDVQRVGPDLRILARPAHRLAAWLPAALAS